MIVLAMGCAEATTVCVLKDGVVPIARNLCLARMIVAHMAFARMAFATVPLVGLALLVARPTSKQKRIPSFCLERRCLLKSQTQQRTRLLLSLWPLASPQTT